MRALPQITCVGVTMMSHGKPGTVAFSDPAVIEIDESQYRTGTGPCLDAFRYGTPFVVDSTLEPGRWQQFRDVAAAHGVGSCLAAPLSAQDGTVGALNMYARNEHVITAEDVDVAMSFATQAAYLLVNAEAYWNARVLGENLERALQSRPTIEQAKGIIMATVYCEPDEAMQLLIQQSQHQNIKLREVAAQIVANTIRHRRR
jgi:GAF domain-containing protein